MLTVLQISASSWGPPVNRGGFAVTGVGDLQGCGRALHPGRVGTAEHCSEGPVQGRDAGELQQPGLTGYVGGPRRPVLTLGDLFGTLKLVAYRRLGREWVD